MSLETDIQNLTKAIESLTAALTKAPVQLDLVPQSNNVMLCNQTTESLETIQESTAPQETTPSYTIEDLQSACSALVRKDTANKTAIRKVLDNFNVKTLGGLKTSEYADFMAQLGEV